MRKKLIITGIILTLLLVGAVALRFLFPATFTSARIAVKFEQPGTTIDIFAASDTANSGSTKVATVAQSSTINLPYGKYYYISSGPNIAPGTVDFEVTGDRTLDVNPALTNDYLATLLAPEQGIIADTIRQAYPQAQNYTIQKGRLYQQGQWYATTLVDKKSTSRDPHDPYRIVLLKENGKWEAVTKPELIISAVDYPGIPVEILRTLNQLDPVLSPETDTTSND